MKNYLTLSLLSLMLMFFTLPAFAVQAPATSANPSATVDWKQMEDMAEKKWQKKLVRKLEKQEAKLVRKGKTTAGDSWLVALLLAIFLGYLGIDRFYLGYPGIGLLKLFTGGVFGILYVIDIVLIAFGILGPKNGRYLE
jgi:hypothetical protein